MLLSFRGPSSLSYHCHMLTVIDKYFVRYSEEAIFVFITTVSVSDSPINHPRPTHWLVVICSTFKSVIVVTQTYSESYPNLKEIGCGKLRFRKCSLVSKLSVNPCADQSAHVCRLICEFVLTSYIGSFAQIVFAIPNYSKTYFK